MRAGVLIGLAILLAGVAGIAIINYSLDCNRKECEHGEYVCVEARRPLGGALKLGDCACKVCKDAPRDLEN